MRSATISGKYRKNNSNWNNNWMLACSGILSLCDEFVPGDPPEYFFDKNPENFSAILEMHRR